jgi:hypothetical protein
LHHGNIQHHITHQLGRIIRQATTHGLWQDFGTVKEIPRGQRTEQREQSNELAHSLSSRDGRRLKANHGDIGREKKRKAKKWFSRKYYSSVLNLRDFLADNIGQSFVGVVAQALDDNYRRYNH